jgi:hypothetical protein
MPIFCRGRRREIDDSTFDVRTAIFDFHDGALARFDVGYLGRRPQGQRLACRIIRLGLHGRSVSHLVAGEALGIDRRFSDSLMAGGIGRQLFGFVLVRRDNLMLVRLGGWGRAVGLRWFVRMAEIAPVSRVIHAPSAQNLASFSLSAVDPIYRRYSVGAWLLVSSLLGLLPGCADLRAPVRVACGS